MNKQTRTTLVTWVVVYPLITSLLLILEPFVGSWPLPFRTLLLSAIMVPLMVLWAMPFAMARFSSFLKPGETPAACTLSR